MSKLQKFVAVFVLSILIFMPFSGLSLAVPNPENIIQPPSEDPFSGENPQATDDQNQSNLTIQQKQELANKIQAELDQLETEIENQIEDYNAEQVKLNDIQNKLTEASQAFDEINAQYGEKQDIYEKRITEIYKNGSSSLLEVLLSTQSFTDFISRVRFLALIAHRDSSMVDTLMKERTLLRTARDELEQLKQQQEEVMTKLQSKKAEIQAKIAEKSKILSSVEIDIQQIIDEQTKTKAEEQKKLLDELKMKAQSGLTSLTAMLDPSSVISTTLQYLGIRYQWGGEKPETGFDCSGLVLYVFRQHGVIVPHYSGWQFKMGTTVGLSELQPGDLVFFGSPIHHVGIYMGDFNGGKYMIHAPKTGDIIKISDFSTRKDFAGAKRFPLLPRE